MRKLHEIVLSERDRRAVEQAAEALRRDFSVEQVVLFGSKARGDDDEESDIDLLVLTARKVTRDERDRMISAIYELELRLGVVVSFLTVPTEEWLHGLYQVLPLRFEVERDGVAA